jgi:NAD(P)-dependent dehydrogenase (short-subunit alcohol dehydrogenase family)
MLHRATNSNPVRPGRTTVAVFAVAAVALSTLAGPVAELSADQASTPAQSLRGQTVMITGSTDGLGREVALRVASLGAHVIVHGRNQQRGAAVVDDITKAGRGSARFYAADLASLAEVRRLAAEVLRDHPRIDILVNNAGVWNRGDRQVSQDGHELHFAVNYLSGFLLTHLLMPRMVESAPARVINVASAAQSPIDFDDVMLERPGRAAQGYGQSKLAQVMFALDLAAELDGKDVTVLALHPASLMDTAMVQQAGLSARTTVDEGAEAVMRLVTAPGIETGQYFNGLSPARANTQAYDEQARARLRALSVRLVGLE